MKKDRRALHSSPFGEIIAAYSSPEKPQRTQKKRVEGEKKEEVITEHPAEPAVFTRRRGGEPRILRSVYLPLSLYQRWEKFNRTHHGSFNSFVVEALDRYLRELDF